MSAEFLLTSLVVVAIPGTGVLYTVATAMAGGRRHGLFAAVGCTLGIVPHLLAAVLGLSATMQAGGRWTMPPHPSSRWHRSSAGGSC